MAMLGNVRLFMAISGYVCLCRAMYAYLGLSKTMEGCVWLCRAI